MDTGIRTVPPSSAPEGRHSKRNAVKKHASLIVNLQGVREKIPCHIIDISQEGFRLRGSFAQVKQRQVVEINSSEGPPFTALCRVIWVAKPGSKQEGEVGLQCLNRFLDSFKG